MKVLIGVRGVAKLAIAAGAGGLLVAFSSVQRVRTTGEPLRDPPDLRSTNRVLDLRLVATPSTVDIGGRRVTVPSYNGSYLPPTLRVHPGDVLRLRLVNRLDDATNLHLHGLAVSPREMSDNVFREINPGDSGIYEVRIPANHPAGLFWYHPHAHPTSDLQVRAGMAGALVVEGMLDSIPALRGLRERLLLLKATQIDSGRFEKLGIGKGAVRTVNGQEGPIITMRPNERQLWRIANVTSNLYYRLSLAGHSLGVVARDGHRLDRIEWSDTVLLTPAARADVLVQARAPGTYILRTGDIDTGPAGNRYTGAALATLVVRGTPDVEGATPDRLLPVPDLRPAVTNRRTIAYTESPKGDLFYINGKMFDPSRTDVRVTLGAVEEWTIRNEADELHNFHIHQTPFQITEINGVPQPVDGLRDVVDVPIHGEVKVVIPFTDPIILGRFPFHCHLLSHEDKGMMATIEVTRPGSPPPGATLKGVHSHVGR